jgi:hypothetical protein
VTPVRNIVTENPAWNSAKHCVGNALMPAVNVQQIVMLKRCSSVQIHVAAVPKNAKSTTMSIVKNAQKNAVSVKQNAGRWQPDFN